jgi:hypothetical protein
MPSELELSLEHEGGRNGHIAEPRPTETTVSGSRQSASAIGRYLAHGFGRAPCLQLGPGGRRRAAKILSFLKKRSKKPLLMSTSSSAPAACTETKVFWFFFSKKNETSLP